MILQLNANDIMFRITDVVFIVSGVITLGGAWFAFKSAQSKTDDRITLEVSHFKRELEIINERQKSLEARINEVENSLGTVEDELSKKIDAMGKDIQNLSIVIEKNTNEILKQLLSKRK